MKRLIGSIFLVFCLLPAAYDTLAQTRRFAIQLGVFQNPNMERFRRLQDLGSLLQDKHPNGLARIRLGDYTRRVVADSILQIVHRRGFKDAFTFQLDEPTRSPIENMIAASGRNILYTIQVGVYIDRNSIPNTRDLKNLGTLYELQEDGFVKLRLGAFVTRDSANAILKIVRDYGYSRAFITEVSPLVMKRDISAATDDIEESFQTASIYKRMKGKMNGKWDVVVHVYMGGQSVSGYYNDPETGQHKRFSYHGSLDNPVSFASNNRIAPQSLNFNFPDKESGKIISMNLKEVYEEGSVQWEVMSLYRKKVKDYQGEQIGADIYLEYPFTQQLANKAAQQHINAGLVQIKDYTDPADVGVLVEKQLNKNVRLVSALYPKYSWLSETYETKILENDRYIFSVRMLYERINNQTESAITFRSWDLRTGQELTLANQLRPGADRALRTLLRKRLGQRYAKLRPSLTDVNASVEEMLTKYYFTATGISFFRDHKPWSVIEGSITLSVPYKDIAQWLHEKNVVAARR
jgi:hypothetical protein